MKITAIEIYGYGKWIDTAFQPLSQFAVFYGKNEAGKTTLMSFIHSILFGFPTKQSSESRYEPKHSSRYGGRLKLSDTIYGDVIVERIRGKANGDVTVTLANGTVGGDEWLERILYGIDKETYQSLFSFDLKGIEDIQKMDPKKLNRYFLSIGTLGNEQLLKIADRLENKASQYYKPTGRIPVINKKIRQVEAMRKKLQQAKEKNNDYAKLEQHKDQLENEIQHTKEKKQQQEANLKNLQELKANWHYLEEKQWIEERLKQEKLRELPKDGLFQLQTINERIHETQNQINKLQEQLLQINEQLQSSAELRLFDEHQQEIEEIWQEIDIVEPKYDQLEQLKRTLDELNSRFVQQKIKVGLPLDATLPNPLSNEAVSQLQTLAEEQEECSRRKATVQERIQYLDYQNQLIQEQLDKLEQKLWDNQTFKEKENELEKQKIDKKTEPKTREKRSLFQSKRNAGSLLMVSLLLLAGGWIVGQTIGIVMMGIGLILAVFSGKVWVKPFSDKKSVPEEEAKAAAEWDHTDSLFEKVVQQKEYRSQWRERLAEGDQVAAELDQLFQQKNLIEDEVKEKYQQQEEWREKHHIPVSLSMEQLRKNEAQYAEMRKTASEIKESEQWIEQLEAETSTWEKQAKLLEDVLYLDWHYMPGVVNKIKDMQQRIKTALTEQEGLVQQEREIHGKMQQWIKQQKELEQKKRQLFQTIAVNNEEAFKEKYRLFQELTDQNARLQLLESQFADNQEAFNAFADLNEVAEQMASMEKEIAQLAKTEEKKLNERINCTLSLQRLEEGGGYSEILQETANLESELQELVDQWSSYKIASFLIERTLSLAKKDRLPETIKDTAAFFALLTREQYQNVLLSENKLVVQRQDGVLFDTFELSTGTAEQLYVALRFAFIKNTLDLVQLPLIIDDGFVNFDANRKKEVLSLMKQMSAYTQVLYFTFDEAVEKVVQQDEIEMLY